MTRALELANLSFAIKRLAGKLVPAREGIYYGDIEAYLAHIHKDESGLLEIERLFSMMHTMMEINKSMNQKLKPELKSVLAQIRTYIKKYEVAA